MRAICISDAGNREPNEDSYYDGDNLFIVCDGVGGAVYGDVAAKLACTSISEYIKNHTAKKFDRSYLQKILDYNVGQFQKIEQKYPEMKGMSTTVVFIAFNADKAVVGWMGDSRLYHIRRGEILFVTEDHSLINELRKAGNADEAQLKNIRKNYITKSLGAKTKDEFSLYEIYTDKIISGDYFFLCTDGILENITNEILCEKLNAKATLDEKAQEIFSLCKGRTNDNFTFQLVEI